MAEPVLSIRGLSTEFRTREGAIRAVDDVSLDVEAGTTVGIVGESGSGKSTLGMSVLGLIKPPGRVVAGEIIFEGKDLLQLRARDLRAVRGRGIGAVFQNPQTSLDPSLTIGDQVSEAILAHQPRLAKETVRGRALESLTLAGIPAPESLWKRYAFELSGGMRQRVMIAIATVNHPSLLIADEPTTALDVTTQIQVIEAFRRRQQDIGAATMLITHNLGLVAEFSDHVVVMYGGRIVETGQTDAIFARPRHPYTAGLLTCLPRVDIRSETLLPIPGNPPNLAALPAGCAFQPRCSLSSGRAECMTERPALRATGSGYSACHFAEELEAPDAPVATPTSSGHC
jgi:oligopeptide/dipeptide ABC transporter ATP-binding protein